MKSIITNTGLLLFAVFAVLLFSGVECNPDNPGPQTNKCGKFIEDSYQINHDELKPSEHFTGVTQDGKAQYIYTTPTVHNVCIEEHVKYKVTAYTPDMPLAGVFNGEFIYGISYKYYFGPLEYDYNNILDYPYYDYAGEAGLKSGIDDPGWFFIALTITFNDKGSDEQNHDHLLYIVEYLNFQYEYYEPKEDS